MGKVCRTGVLLTGVGGMVLWWEVGGVAQRVLGGSMSEKWNGRAAPVEEWVVRFVRVVKEDPLEHYVGCEVSLGSGDDYQTFRAVGPVTMFGQWENDRGDSVFYELGGLVREWLEPLFDDADMFDAVGRIWEKAVQEFKVDYEELVRGGRGEE